MLQRIEIPYKFTVDTHEGSSVRTEKIVIKDKNSNISAEVTVIQNGLVDIHLVILKELRMMFSWK